MTTQQALEWYRSFGGKPNHVATVPCILALTKLLKQRPRRVLEIGGGQGTLTKLILGRTAATVDVVEEIPALRDKLRELGSRVRAFNYEEIPHGTYDLVVIDGPEFKSGRADVTYQIVKSVGRSTYYFVEGRRDDQRLAISRQPRRRATSLSIDRYWVVALKVNFRRVAPFLPCRLREDYCRL
jgi:hypothetical protein